MVGRTLWSGRFDGDVDSSTLEFTSSLDVDAALSFYDVMGSLAHVKMLKECKIIPDEDADVIINGLKKIRSEIESGEFKIDRSLEDIHTNIEFRLTDIVGHIGGKLHTARSRNDQVVTDFKMYLRDVVLNIVSLIDELINALIEIAKKEDLIIPGFTHTQHAQPVTIAQHALAHIFKLERDASRFLEAFDRMNYCPLGSAALAGTTYPIDRIMVAEALGFKAPTQNSMDSVSDRDFATELAFCSSLTAIHLSSMAEELINWSSQEFNFIEMDDAYTTGSSIMPQKKNPDIAELIRGKTGSIIGNLVTMLVMIKGLPLSYNRDLQEDKAPVMLSLESLHKCLVMMSKIVSTLRFNENVIASKVALGFINATDLADYLAIRGLTFREAHGVVGTIVRYCIEGKKNLEDLSLGEFKEFSELFEDDVYDYISMKSCVERRNSFGGTSTQSTSVQLDHAIQNYARRKDIIKKESNFINACWSKLIS
ncbi:MAG: argininosuccinate lyase [archaeon]|nr:argininosuccinate lyase [archaeon]